MPIKAKGIVRAVTSGDCLTIARTGKDAFEEQCYLAYVQAPRVGNYQRSEEPFAFEAREFVRSKLIGQKIDFTIEYMIKERRFVTIKWEDSSINLMLAEKSLAKANERKSNNDTYAAIAAASETASAAKSGVWNTDEKHLAKHNRTVTYHGEQDYKPEKILASQPKEPQPAILEHVFGTNFVSLYLSKASVNIKMQMVHLYTPKETEQEVVDAGKSFVAKMLLHREVSVKLTRVDDYGNLVGRIFFPKGDIGTEILNRGLAKLSTPRDTNFDAEYFAQLKKA